MSTRELERVEVIGRVAHKVLKLSDAAAMLELSYRQVKRLWRRYQRVERNHGIHQDRLIKKMRRKGVHSYEGANEYLENEYLPAHNRRFTVGKVGGLSRAEADGARTASDLSLGNGTCD